MDYIEYIDDFDDDDFDDDDIDVGTREVTVEGLTTICIAQWVTVGQFWTRQLILQKKSVRYMGQAVLLYPVSYPEKS